TMHLCNVQASQYECVLVINPETGWRKLILPGCAMAGLSEEQEDKYRFLCVTSPGCDKKALRRLWKRRGKINALVQALGVTGDDDAIASQVESDVIPLIAKVIAEDNS
ncbi:hypothetical protein KJ766_03365, partial [Patescibacteria group bacterium]|nr:hypothetical protein [Patescibacteria group bacterium]